MVCMAELQRESHCSPKEHCWIKEILASQARFAASGPGRHAIIGGTMNSTLYQRILKKGHLTESEPNLKKKWVIQQDDDPKHTSRSTKEWIKKNEVRVLEWPNQRPDLNSVEMLGKQFM